MLRLTYSIDRLFTDITYLEKTTEDISKKLPTKISTAPLILQKDSYCKAKG